MLRHKKSLSRLTAWALLSAAVVLEVVGTTVMTFTARHHESWGYWVMMGAIAVSYVLLAQAVRVIPLGISYAIWEGLGLLLIAIIGVVAFNETLSLTKGCGLILAVGGIVLISTGESASSESSRRQGVMP